MVKVAGGDLKVADSRLPGKHGGAGDDDNLFTFEGMPRYGADGQPVKGAAKKLEGVTPIKPIAEEQHHHGIEVHHAVELVNDGQGGWYRAESGRLEQERKAWVHLAAIQATMDRNWQMGTSNEKRWTNDPDVIDDTLFPEVVPFPPCESSRHVPHARRIIPERKQQAYQPPPPPRPLVHRRGSHGCAECGGCGCHACCGPGHHSSQSQGQDSFDAPQFGASQASRRKSKSGCGICGGGGGCDVCGHHHKQGQGSSNYVPITPSAQVGDALSEAGDHTPPVHDSVKHVRPWIRLVEFAQTCGPGCSGAVSVMPDNSHHKVTHCGRVFQGELDNSYMVEALNAISLRPKLVRQLFHCWDVERSIYILSLFKNGTWLRVEIDDYVPASRDNHPYCCRSEYFPEVLWPCLVEKAYAKACTVRGPNVYHHSGGWEALGGGGHVDDALSDLTGGVAGSWRTGDVSPDRLFIYLHALQRECLFVCRVHIGNCTKNGVTLNPLAYHAVNRAAHVEGGCYVQVLCSSEKGVHSGGLDNLAVPDSLWRLYPEKAGDGFVWMNAYDFHFYFDVIYECRLVNSPDVGIEGMPPPRHEPVFGPGLLPTLPYHEYPVWAEWLFANAGAVTERAPPEYGLNLPEAPCEVIIAVEQTDTRIVQLGADRKPHVSVLLKVYEQIRGDAYSSVMVCKSNWMPVRGAMVAFKSTHGGQFKIVAEMTAGARCDRLVFRCYTSHPGAIASAGTSMQRHLLAQPEDPPLGLKWTFVGVVPSERLARADAPCAAPQDLDELRREHDDEKCSVM
mmetsp:Transcript_59165/g.152179  ORF Transcript_59165/g.152179 Transcript_59165/m.152179 type:complete len:789 (-) Transcript_59165:48-2414(-)